MKQATYQIIVDVYDNEPRYLLTVAGTDEKLAASGNAKALGWALQQLLSKKELDNQ